MAEDIRKPTKLTGHTGLIQRLVLSTLTGRPVRISRIRESSKDPGLRPHEISFLRLLEAITNGSHIEISLTGTTLLYRPGIINGSAPGSGASSGVITHEVTGDCTRGISFFLIPLCLLAPFSKAQFNVVFSGSGVITSSTETGDVSADTVRTAILPLYAGFGISNKIELRILKRSNAGPAGRGGGGEVQLIFGHQVRFPKTLHLMNPGSVKKIRGVAYSTGVSASNNARMIEAARGVLNSFVPDTYVFSDVSSAPLIPVYDRSNPGAKKKIGLGFGLSLVAESSTGCLYSADVASPPEGGETPEDIGRTCAYMLLESVSQGGTVSSTAAPTVLTLMAMGSEDVGRLLVGPEVVVSEAMVTLARDLHAFGFRDWGLREAPSGSGEVVMAVVGGGVGNVAKKIA